MHSVLNILKFTMDVVNIDKEQLEEINNLDYLSQIIFTLHEDLNASLNDDKRFQVTIRVNRGANMTKAPLSETKDHTIDIDLNHFSHIKRQMTLEDLDSFFAGLFMEKPLSPSH